MLIDSRKIYNHFNAVLKSTNNFDVFIFNFIDFLQYLVLYFILSIIGLRTVFAIEKHILDDISPKTKIFSLKVMSEILFMLGLNIMIYILIVYFGKSVPSLAKSIYPKMKESPVVYFIESFIVLFILVIGDVRLEHYLERMRN
jgi:cytochrome c biogenesis factor